MEMRKRADVSWRERDRKWERDRQRKREKEWEREIKRLRDLATLVWAKIHFALYRFQRALASEVNVGDDKKVILMGEKKTQKRLSARRKRPRGTWDNDAKGGDQGSTAGARRLRWHVTSKDPCRLIRLLHNVDAPWKIRRSSADTFISRPRRPRDRSPHTKHVDRTPIVNSALFGQLEQCIR